MTDKSAADEIEPHWRQFYDQRRFAILLVVLLMLLGGSPLVLGLGRTAVWYEGLISLVMFAAILSLCVERRQRWFALLLGIPTILLSLGSHSVTGSGGHGMLLLGHLCGVLFLFGSAGLIVQTLFQSNSLTFDSIFGTVCGYLFLGLGWALTFSMIETAQPDSFEVSEAIRASGDNLQLQVLTYFSFITLSTVGYGDVSPVSPTARTFTWIAAITGHFYMAIIVAGLVSMLVSKSNVPRGTKV